MLKLNDQNEFTLEFQIGGIEQLSNFNKAIGAAIAALGTEEGRQMVSGEKVEHYIYWLAGLHQTSQLEVDLYWKLQEKEKSYSKSELSKMYKKD